MNALNPIIAELRGSTDDLQNVEIIQDAFITPDKALKLLNGYYTKNRKRLAAVDLYAQEMTDGKWRHNGDTIVVDINQRLISGHLRLLACVKASKGFHTVIVAGVSPDADCAIGAHRKRTTATALQIKGYQSTGTLVTGVNRLWQIANGCFGDTNRSASPTTIYDYIEKNPKVASTEKGSSLSIAIALNSAKVMSTANGMWLHYLLSHTTGANVDEFFRVLITGEASDGHPALAARKRLSPKEGQATTRAPREVASVVLRAWRAFYEGKELRSIPLSNDTSPWVLPEIKGLSVNFEDFLPTSVTVVAKKNNIVDFASKDGGQIQKNLRAEIVLVTPELASEWLEFNSMNRKIREVTIANYARDFRAGKFMLNGDSIKLSKSGRLLDGQHRCYACVRTGVPFYSVVVDNVDDSAFETYDMGKPRSLVDKLTDANHRNASAISTALRYLIVVENGLRLEKAEVSQSELTMAYKKYYSDIHDYDDIVADYRLIGIPASVLLAAYYRASKINQEDADKFFFHHMRDKIDLSVGHPAHTLIQKLASRSGITSNSPEKYVWVVKAWNAFRENKKINGNHLRWRNQGAHHDPAPQMV